MLKTTVDAIDYSYEVESDRNVIECVNVYSGDEEEHIVGVFFNHDMETVVVEGPDLQESANYFELRDMSPENLVSWAVAQIPV